MIKFRLYFDKDKETVWVNEMAARGYAMTGFFAGFYTFEKCEPGEYTYQVDFGNKLFSVTDDYREFMEETGVEIVQIWGFWVILRKKTEDGSFELYTDVDSQITHYTKIRNMFKIFTIIDLICFMIEVLCYYQAPAENRLFSFICTVFVGTVAVVIMKAALKTNQIINELKERKGEITTMKKTNVSPILLVGLFLNICTLAINNPSLDIYKIIAQVIAIVLMLIGIYQTSRNMKNK